MNGTKIVGGGSAGAGIGAVAVYIAGRFGANLTPEDGAIIASSAVAVVAFVAHNGGIIGAVRTVLRGSRTAPAKSSAADVAAGLAPRS